MVATSIALQTGQQGLTAPLVQRPAVDRDVPHPVHRPADRREGPDVVPAHEPHVAVALDGHDGKTHDGPSMAGMHALDVATGRILWSTPADNLCAGREFCEPGISQAVTAIPGAVIAGHMDGRLRAYDADTGRVFWQVDTARDWPTVSGETARGGSFGGGAGPVVADGRLIARSGYGIYFHMPGNVMLVFGARR